MLIDLTHTLKNGMPVYPGSRAFRAESDSRIETDGFAELGLELCTHTGTHMDAPSHILPGTTSLDQFSVDAFAGSALVLDCSQQPSITLDILNSCADDIRMVKFLLMYTGWEQKWNTPDYFHNFPTLSEPAARLLSRMNLQGIGLDTLSVDKVTDDHLPNHHILLGQNILIIENLTNLHKLLGNRFEFQCFPLKIDNSDAAPVRAMARLMDDR